MRVLYESHMHTPLCHHAQGEPEEYAAMAYTRGLKGMIVTCHNPPIDGWSPQVRMAVDEFDTYVAMVERARTAWAGRVDVRLGLECDYVPGMEAALEQQLAQADFHHVLGSLHPQIQAYKDRYFTGDIQAYQELYFDHLAQAAETGLFDTLSHPDLIKIVFPQDWDPTRIQTSIDGALDRIAATGVNMELNTSGLQKAYPEMNPGRSILAAMHARGIPVVLGADAHVPTRVAADYVDALTMLQEVGYTQVNIVLDRQSQPVEIDAALASLAVTYV